jgi:hypothetical protein
MFAALFLLFGIALAPVFDRTLRWLAQGSPIAGGLAFLGVVLAGLLLGLGLVSRLGALASGPTTDDAINLIMLGIVVVGLAVRALGQRLASPPWRLASYGLLIAAVLVGAAYTYRSIAAIVT